MCAPECEAASLPEPVGTTRNDRDTARGRPFCAGHRTAGMEFRVIQGDIAQQSADALVDAAGTSLRMGSGAAGTLRRAGGEALNAAAVGLGGVAEFELSGGTRIVAAEIDELAPATLSDVRFTYSDRGDQTAARAAGEVRGGGG